VPVDHVALLGNDIQRLGHDILVPRCDVACVGRDRALHNEVAVDVDGRRLDVDRPVIAKSEDGTFFADDGKLSVRNRACPGTG
jgi:hypothetical protein